MSFVFFRDIIGYFESIFFPSHIRVDPTHHGVHSHMRERKYTLGVSNKFLVLYFFGLDFGLGFGALK